MKKERVYEKDMGEAGVKGGLGLEDFMQFCELAGKTGLVVIAASKR